MKNILTDVIIQTVVQEYGNNIFYNLIYNKFIIILLFILLLRMYHHTFIFYF